MKNIFECVSHAKFFESHAKWFFTIIQDKNDVHVHVACNLHATYMQDFSPTDVKMLYISHATRMRIFACENRKNFACTVHMDRMRFSKYFACEMHVSCI